MDTNRYNYRGRPVAFEYRDRILVWCGSHYSDEWNRCRWESSELHVFNPNIGLWQTDTLKTTGRVPEARSAAGFAVSEEKRLYVFGGLSSKSNDPLNDLHCLDLETRVWIELKYTLGVPTLSNKLSWLYECSLYSFGGFGMPDPRYPRNPNFEFQEIRTVGYTNELSVINLGSERCIIETTLRDAPSPRSGAAAVLFGDYVYLFGGKTASFRLNDLYKYDLRKSVWIQLHPVIMNHMSDLYPRGRSDHSLTLVNDRTACLYGGMDSGDEVLNDLWLLTLDEKAVFPWTKIKLFERSPLRQHIGVCYKGDLVAVAGLKVAEDFEDDSGYSEKVLRVRFRLQPLKTILFDYILRRKELQLRCDELPFSLKEEMKLLTGPI